MTSGSKKGLGMKKTNKGTLYFVSALQVIIAAGIFYAIAITNGAKSTGMLANNPVTQEATATIILASATIPEPTNTATDTPKVNTSTPTIEESITNEIIYSTSIPNTLQVKEIIKTIEIAYALETEMSVTLDISKLSTVYTNDPRFIMSEEVLKTVRELTNNPELESAGYLDYKMAYWTWRRDSTLLYEAVHKKAKEENRDLTKEEIASLIDPYGRVAHPRIDRTDREQLNSRIEFISVAINGDIAVVVLNRPDWKLEQTLVCVDQKWYIADVKGLQSHQ
jgi:hypothetical protein